MSGCVCSGMPIHRKSLSRFSNTSITCTATLYFRYTRDFNQLGSPTTKSNSRSIQNKAEHLINFYSDPTRRSTINRAEDAEMNQKSIDQLLQRPQKRKEREVIEVFDVADEVEIATFGDEVIAENGISCPVCSVDLARLSLEARQSHVELCLLQPNQHKLTRTVVEGPSAIKRAKSTSKTPPTVKKPVKKPKYIPAPDFKILTFKRSQVKIIVDGFNYSFPKTFLDDLNPQEGDDDDEYNKDEVLYFLSHFHADHYGGLFKNWHRGQIWCSTDTCDLAHWKFGLNKRKEDDLIEKDGIIMKSLEFDRWYELVDDEKDKVGVRVKLYDANHCPGGAIFLFEEYLKVDGKDEEVNVIKRILHTGDFRVSFKHIEIFQDMYIDEIYLDTTYLNPMYKFHNQSTIISETCKFFKNLIMEGEGAKNSILNYFNSSKINDGSKYRILIGSYSLGKEKLFLSLSEALNTKIYMTTQRYKLLSKITALKPYLHLFQTNNDNNCLIHVVNLRDLRDQQYLEKLKCYQVIKIRPTGWSFSSFQKKANTSMNKKRKFKVKEDLEILESQLDCDDDVEIFDIKEEDEPQPEPEPEPETIPILPSPSPVPSSKVEIINSLFQPISTTTIQQTFQTQYSTSTTLQVPYSEHSSFKELSILGISLNWGIMIPTVSVSKKSEFQEWFDLWKEKNVTMRKNHNERERWEKNVYDYYHDLS